MFSDHNGIKIEIKNRKPPNYLEVKQHYSKDDGSIKNL